MKGVADLVYACAPHAVAGGCDGACTWWTHDNPGDDPFADRPISLKGWKESREMLARLWKEHGPFDGLFGFSQGGVAVHQLAVEITLMSAALLSESPVSGMPHPELEWGEAEHAFLRHPPKMAIMAAAFPSRSHHTWEARTPLALRSLHISSPHDVTVKQSLQKDLESRFVPQGRVCLEHEKGHSVPQRAAELHVLKSFISLAV